MTPAFTGWLMIVVILMTFGESTSYLIWESLIGKTTTGYKNVATSIGFLHVPSNLVLIPSFIFTGLLIHEFGYIAPFWIAGVFFLIYSIGAMATSEISEQLERPVWITSTLYARYPMDKFTSSMARS